jgi:hypothetical protein
MLSSSGKPGPDDYRPLVHVFPNVIRRAIGAGRRYGYANGRRTLLMARISVGHSTPRARVGYRSPLSLLLAHKQSVNKCDELSHRFVQCGYRYRNVVSFLLVKI